MFTHIHVYLDIPTANRAQFPERNGLIITEQAWRVSIHRILVREHHSFLSFWWVQSKLQDTKAVGYFPAWGCLKIRSSVQNELVDANWKSTRHNRSAHTHGAKFSSPNGKERKSFTFLRSHILTLQHAPVETARKTCLRDLPKRTSLYTVSKQTNHSTGLNPRFYMFMYSIPLRGSHTHAVLCRFLHSVRRIPHLHATVSCVFINPWRGWIEVKIPVQQLLKLEMGREAGKVSCLKV